MTPKSFRHWRKSLELSQKEAASALGLKRRVVQYYEKGERDGEKIEIPKYIRLACHALTQGVHDYNGPEPNPDAAAIEETAEAKSKTAANKTAAKKSNAKAPETDKPKKAGKTDKSTKVGKPAKSAKPPKAPAGDDARRSKPDASSGKTAAAGTPTSAATAKGKVRATRAAAKGGSPAPRSTGPERAS